MNLTNIWGRSAQSLDDAELVVAFYKTGRSHYFDVLFERYHAHVYALCLQVIAEREESKDVTISVFAEAFYELRQQEVKNFEHWLMKKTRNACITAMRTRSRRLAREKKWYDLQKSEETFMENEFFRRLIYEEELEQDTAFRHAFAQLSHEQQLCMQMFVWELKSYQEIADETGWELGSVKSYLQNGRRRLKVLLHNIVQQP
ncbi:MAG: sigma-70 family RNA polymerase sigma factor [Saprospiraceae bacterium]